MPRAKAPATTGEYICKADGQKFGSLAALKSHERALARQTGTPATPIAGKAKKTKARGHRQPPATPPMDALTSLTNARAEVMRSMNQAESELKTITARQVKLSEELTKWRGILGQAQPAPLTQHAGGAFPG